MVKQYKPLIISASAGVLLICIFVIYAIIRRVRKNKLPSMSPEVAKEFDWKTTNARESKAQQTSE